jgi:hypothetical protein
MGWCQYIHHQVKQVFSFNQFRELDLVLVRVKRKTEPVAIFKLLGLNKELDKTVFDELQSHLQFLVYYHP